ncbi:PREDICTED: matrilin-2-like [Ceratosolen solmsi marchali]|uniref:Matrilin-2-like n=1 Tax=Ceratosolen solmsi marchali TaxID=326594 RepID=A0AAJ7E2Q3_9HYME|nr:PREDICTED: matrilin-2-like [Ceratosolen solmsi marchali]
MLDLDDENTSATVMIIVGNRCIKKTDCRSLVNSHCGLDKKCTCNRAHFWSEELNACVPEIGEKCGSVDEKYKVKYSVCKDEAWTCEADRVNLKSNQDCRKLLKKIGSSCQYREQCQLFGPAAHCVEGQCICGAESHWLSDEKFCWINKKINEQCWSQNDCYSRSPGLQSFCDRSTAGGFCSCPTGSHHSADKGYCISDKPELDSYCEENEDCELDYSYCNDNKCKCQENYIVLDGLCQAGLNAICTADIKCKQSNTTCSEKNVCKCKEHFIASPDNECIPIASFEKECMYDVQCTSVIPNTHCAFNKLPLKDLTDNEYGKCKCIPGYFYNMDSCFKKKWLGEECTKEGECFVESSRSFCRNGRCVCGFDYMQEGNQCRQVNSESTINTYSVFQLVAAIFVLLKML